MPRFGFDAIAATFDDQRAFPGEIGEQLRDGVVRLIGAHTQTRFLETGVGTGRIAAPFVRAGYHYVGVDLSAAMLARCRLTLARTGGRIALARADMTRLPFPDGAVDVVIAASVYRAVRSWQAAATEASRVLTRPGVLVLVRPVVETGSMDELLRRTKRQFLRERGLGADPDGGADETEVAAWFQSRGATLSRFETDAWRERLMSDRLIARHLRGHRVAGQPWAAELARELASTASAMYGSFDAEAEIVRRLTVHVLRFPGESGRTTVARSGGTFVGKDSRLA